MPVQVFRGACTESPRRAGGRGFIEHNWDWGDIQLGAMGVGRNGDGLVGSGRDELNESASVVFIVIQNLGCSE